MFSGVELAAAEAECRYPAYRLLLQARRFEDKEITFILSLFMFAAACLFAAEMEECIVGKSCDTSRPGIRGGVEHSNKTAEKKTLRWAELGVGTSKVLHRHQYVALHQVK